MSGKITYIVASQRGLPHIARALRAEPAIFALIVDAKDEAARQFYLHHGFRRFASRPMTLYLPLAEAARRLGAAQQ